MMLPNYLFSKHLIGGEMSYICLDNGDYEITLRVYRDCLTDGAEFDKSISFSIFQCDVTIDCTTLTQGSQGFVFEVDLDTVEILNYPDPTCELPQLCVEKGVYRFQMSEFGTFLPNTNNSYHIVHQRCCRNERITNLITPEEFGNTFTIAITPAAQELCNNSPILENFPPVFTCINEPFEFQNRIVDEEGDSIVYAFSTPLHGGGNDVTRANFESCTGAIPNPSCPPPFSIVSFIEPIYDSQHPLGSSAQSIHLDSNTGLIVGTPTIAGQFVVGLSIKEYRNGELLSLTHREFQINVIDCQNTSDRIRSTCDDGNPNTERDRIQEDCSCRGVLKEKVKNAQDVFISEYLESTGATKCLEIYNPLDQVIPTGEYVIKLYSKDHPDGIVLHEIKGIAPFETYVICQEGTDTNITDIADGIFTLSIDGKEAISIERGGSLVDLFGNRSCFPEDFWRGTTFGMRSLNKTLVRCPCIRRGTKTDPFNCEFPTLSREWIGLSADDFTNIGTHDTLVPMGSFLESLSDIFCACELTCRERDSLVLVDFYRATNGQKWLNQWDLNQPINTWFGVFLNEEGCLTCLDLDGVADCKQTNDTESKGNNVTGHLTDRIGELENLEALYLSHNQLSSVLPRSIGRMSQLQKIWVNNNKLVGDFPVGLILLDDLQEVVLDYNQITGELPPEMAQLVQLTTFTVSNNLLIGCFPDSYLDFCSNNVNFSNNLTLPWQGDFETFCLQTTAQIGSSCNDGKEETIFDTIQKDCMCKGQLIVEQEDCININTLGETQDATPIISCTDSVTLIADSLPLAFSTHWSSSNEALIINNPEASSTTVRNLPLGTTLFTRQVDTVNCISYVPTTYTVTRPTTPNLTADTVALPDKEVSITFNTLSNDNLEDSVFLYTELLTFPQLGILTDFGEGEYEWQPTNIEYEDQFTYKVCYVACRSICDQTTVTLQIEAEVAEEIEIGEPQTFANLIPNAITPNGDGLNDQLIFPQLQDPLAFSHNELLIFNRWGDIIFTARPYDNSWSGMGEQGKDLPEGTYYYILRLDVGAGLVIKGEVVVLR